MFFVAFWERLMENQRRRVAISPALQPTGARFAALERQTQMRKKGARQQRDFAGALRGCFPTRDHDWELILSLSGFISLCKVFVIVSFGIKGLSHHLFSIPHVLTFGKRNAVVMKDFLQIFLFSKAHGVIVTTQIPENRTLAHFLSCRCCRMIGFVLDLGGPRQCITSAP